MNSKILKDILVIATLKSLPDLKRQPLMLTLIGLISALPLFFIIVFGGQLSYGLIGAMVGTIGFIGLNAAIQDITWDRYVKIRQIIVAMPVHPLSYAIGIALAPLIISAPSVLFFTVFAIWLGALTFSSLLWSIIILILCWATLSSLGFLISTHLQRASVYTLNNLANILGLALVFLPPVYYPEEMLGSFSWIAMLFPTSNVTGLIRVYSGSLDASVIMIVIRWLILIATTIFCIVATITKARWRET
ncbi:MAG: ABC transporter permease [Candidatus Bathyarchaeia archaeon]|nr:ABC transporter permease [Candidatus Bathyarchaeia archaeon]